MTGLKGEICVIYKLTMNRIMRYDASRTFRTKYNGADKIQTLLNHKKFKKKIKLPLFSK